MRIRIELAALTILASVPLAFAQSAPTSRPTSTQAAPTIEVSVDARVELLSVIFRLAGHPEYNHAKVLSSYAKDIDAHFAPVKDHPVVRTAQRLRSQYGVSYDAPMGLAVHLTDAKSLQPLVPLDPWPEGLDTRWKPDELKTFLEQARDFVTASRFQSFFDAHKPLYDLAVSRMRTQLRTVHPEWFDTFFGTQLNDRFHLTLGVANGPHCYGPRLVGRNQRDLYCILGIWLADAQGQPRFDSSVLSTVVHEFAHSYANPLTDKWEPQLRPAGQALYRTRQEQMTKMAYGNWQTMMRESLVRVAVVRHTFRYQGAAAATKAALAEQAQGFTWMPQLSDLLAQYERQRSTYPTLDAFMPKVVEFFNAFPTN